MAYQTMTSYLDAISAQTFRPVIIDQANKSHATWDWWYRRRKKDWTSEIISVPVYLANPGQAGHRSRGQASLVNAVAKEDKAQWTWDEIVGGFGIDQTDIDLSGGPEAAVTLLSGRAKQAKAEMVKLLITSLLQAKNSFTDKPNMEGLGQIMSASAVHGNIDPTGAGNSNWKAYSHTLKTANTLAAVDMAAMIADSEAQWGGGKKVFLCNSYTFATIFAIAQGNQRFVEDKEFAQIGHPNFTVAGVPVFVEPQVPGTGNGTSDSELYLVCMDAMELFVHPRRDWATKVTETREFGYVEEYSILVQLVDYRRNAHGFNKVIDPAN